MYDEGSREEYVYEVERHIPEDKVAKEIFFAERKPANSAHAAFIHSAGKINYWLMLIYIVNPSSLVAAVVAFSADEVEKSV